MHAHTHTHTHTHMHTHTHTHTHTQGSESNESEFIPGDNPVYDIGAETDYTTLPEEVGEQDSRTRGNTRQLSFDEREFDNPIYASEIEGDNHYDDLEVLPPHLYDRVYSNW